jgi:hypothetical protein
LAIGSSRFRVIPRGTGGITGSAGLYFQVGLTAFFDVGGEA